MITVTKPITSISKFCIRFYQCYLLKSLSTKILPSTVLATDAAFIRAMLLTGAFVHAVCFGLYLSKQRKLTLLSISINQSYATE